jgi:dolichol-phosphate mannosyltransferase
MKLSIVLPAYNEAGSLGETLNTLYAKLQSEKIEHEILVVNDNSKDNTLELLTTIQKSIPTLVFHTNHGPNGFGYAIRYGLERFQGDCVAIMMADLSDDPSDLVIFYKRLCVGDVDCVFGSRFIKGGEVVNYPFMKLIINRIANLIIKITIGIKYNDSTNAFKLYKRTVINGISPLISPHFNLTIELSLKSIIRGYTYDVIPNKWFNRKEGVSKLKIKEMGSRYFFILVYCFVEKYFSKGDYKKSNNA